MNIGKPMFKLGTMPLVFRVAIMMLGAAFITGQVTQHQPAGRISKALLATVVIHCPAASASLSRPTVGAVESTVDQAMWWTVEDWLAPRKRPRCKPS